MSPQENKEIFRKFSEKLWIEKDLSAFDGLFSDDYADGEVPSNPVETLKAFFDGYFKRRPDMTVTRNFLLADEDYVVQHIQARFTNRERRLGGQGVIMEMNEVNIFQFKDGKIIGRIGVGQSLPADVPGK